jgi:transposase InsO family protein
MVTKKDGTKRFCVDFRTLNDNTIKDTYPLPNVEDMIERFKGCIYFTQLDLASGYWGIPMHPDDMEKTAFVAPKGKFEFVVMPYGLVNAQATFQRNMDMLVKQLHDEGHKQVEAYVDNIYVFSQTFEDHISTLSRLFHYVDFYNLSLRADKCEFAKAEIECLGFIVNGQTVCPTPDNVKKVKDFPCPTTRKRLQSFLGIANFNRKFIKNYSAITEPLTSMTSSKKKFVWGSAQDEAFQKVKDCISKAPTLRLADWNRVFHIETDASDIAVGAVLFQLGDKGEQLPLAYYSKTLTDTERRWSATDKEMYGIICASRKWYPYCSGSVVFHTDHQPLKYVRKQKDPRGKMARWLIELENYDYKIEYIPGKENVQADYLSRISTPQVSEPDSTQEMASVYFEDHAILPTLEVIRAHQKKDKHIADAKKQIVETGEVTKGIFRSYSNITMSDDILWKGARILLPESLWTHVMREYHGQYHAGAENTVLLIKSRFYWRGMERHIKDFVGKCRTCTQCKVSKGQHSETQIPDTPSCRERLCIDIASMPRNNRGNAYFLQMIDANTKFIATAAITDQQAVTIRDVLWPKWFSYFGIPRSLLSDQGKNVDGNVIRELCKQLNITKLHSSPYHPEGNGSAERSIGSIKSIIRTMCQSRNISVEDWDLLLDEATLAYNNTVNKSTGFSPFKSMFGGSAVLPIDNACKLTNPGSDRGDSKLIQQNAEMNRKEAQKGYKNYLDQKANTGQFVIGDKVLLKRTFGSYPKLSVKWKLDNEGQPYTITKKVGPVNYALRNSKGFERVYHRNLIKPALERVEPTFINPSTACSSLQPETVTIN